MAGNGPKNLLKTALRRGGLELQRYDPEDTYAKRRQRRLQSEQVNVVLDVGAHAGEFGQSLRHGGYAERIVSFEPVAEHNRRLQAAAKADRQWTCVQAAVGDHPGETEIHISGNDGFSSSIRPMAALHETAEPSSSYVDSEIVKVVTLDEAVDELVGADDRLMLKVDAQGFESEVLAGAVSTLQRCRLVELELVFVELYEGQAMFAELAAQMGERDFVLTDVEPGFRDRQTSQLLQIDGLFVR
jgi:FkbM family methyltransferase